MLPANKEQKKGLIPSIEPTCSLLTSPFDVAFCLIGNTHMTGSRRQGDKLT